MDINQLLAGSGITGVLVTLGYGVKMLIDWQRATTEAGTQRASTVVMSAEAANGVVLKSLEAMERENIRLRQRVVDLEASEAEKDKRIDELQAKVQQIMNELTSLRSGQT